MRTVAIRVADPRDFVEGHLPAIVQDERKRLGIPEPASGHEAIDGYLWGRAMLVSVGLSVAGLSLHSPSGRSALAGVGSTWMRVNGRRSGSHVRPADPIAAGSSLADRPREHSEGPAQFTVAKWDDVAWPSLSPMAIAPSGLGVESPWRSIGHFVGTLEALPGKYSALLAPAWIAIAGEVTTEPPRGSIRLAGGGAKRGSAGTNALRHSVLQQLGPGTLKARSSFLSLEGFGSSGVDAIGRKLPNLSVSLGGWLLVRTVMLVMGPSEG